MNTKEPTVAKKASKEVKKAFFAPPKKEAMEDDFSVSSSDSDDASDFSEAKHITVKIHQRPKKADKKISRRVTVVVEDASDSEYEDDDRTINDAWRNRRPSPGVLMEPVDFDEK